MRQKTDLGFSKLTIFDNNTEHNLRIIWRSHNGNVIGFRINNN